MLNSSKEMVQKRVRASWTPVVDKTFLEACIHEVTIHGRDGFKPVSWRAIAEKLKNEHTFVVDQKKMRNHYDYLKGKYTAWSKLKNKTGNVYNPVTNMFTLSEEEWQLEIKANPKVESLRRAPLDHPELCTQLFEGSTSTGFDSWGPSSTFPRPSVNINLDETSDTQMHMVISQESSYRSGNKRNTSTEGASEESPVMSKKGKKKDTFKSKVLEVGEDISKVANMLLERNQDADKCFEKLNALGWERTDAKYQTTLLLFGESSGVRRVFLLLEPDTCEQWVRNAGGKYGLFGS
ncbi:hypothetical protein SSX86_001286 [Deinandra increscens subsp. villosa]|uniref:Myb/SANT-like domain-containing protein n=1 Tax=Deinandra increscens subsp. villosa TaxID=3103831 RepID=A0AAP0DYS1_9ASTR